MAGAEAQTRPAFAGLRLLAVVAASSPAPAAAGAWIAPEGGQQIYTTGVGERDEAPFYEGGLVVEIPVDVRTSVASTTWVETNHDVGDGWRGDATFGVKRVLHRDENYVMAVQAGALWVSDPSDRACGEGGAELRWLGGRSFGESGFINLEAAARGLSGGCEGGRVEITTGYRPANNWLTMGQVFLDAPVEGDETLRAQLTAVRFFENGRGLQLSIRARIDGGAPEPTLVIGWWGRADD